MKWFVYTNTTYYPGAVVVEAETADEAMTEAIEELGEEKVRGMAVFPLDSLAKWTGLDPIATELRS